MLLGEYLLTVAFVSSVVGVLEFLFYPSAGKEAARLCAAVVIIHAFLSPVLSFAASFPEGTDIFGDLEQPDIPFEDSYSEVAEEAFLEGICKLLCSRYGLDAEHVSVSAESFDVKEMRARRVTVLLSGTAALADYRGIEAYLNGLSLGNCEVRIRIG